MRRGSLFRLMVLLVMLISVLIPGAFAAWQYYSEPNPADSTVPSGLGQFTYGLLYITKVEVTGGEYSTANAAKTADLDISADVSLNASSASSVTVDVTFYNSTDVSYYYKETEDTSWSNASIGFESDVSDLTASELNGQQIREIPSKTFKTIRVTIGYEGDSVSDPTVTGSLRFHFVVDKNDVGGIVAQTAVDRFRDILNNKVAPDSYQTLEDAMNNRTSGNKASAVTYIGNVSGANSGDSKVLNDLFGAEFMSMDLDGDGKAEPITIMVKRLNLDDDVTTGDSYSYTTSSWWGQSETRHVHGVEMTLYITAQDLSNVSSGQEIVVYAATFTKLPGATEWTDLVTLTKGKADANNYGGWGDANSFNTDTWASDDGKTIETLVAESIAAKKES